MKDISDHLDWWRGLEPQWQQAFKVSLPGHTNKPGSAELDKLYNSRVIRLAGPAAPYPNIPFELTNLTGIQHLANLEIVIITHHKITGTEVLRDVPRLKSLYLFNNLISGLEGIEALTQLEQLYVQYNRLTTIKTVEQLINLKEFYIHDNCIASLDGLTEKHSSKLLMFVCRPNEQLTQKEIIRVERDLGIICRGL